MVGGLYCNMLKRFCFGNTQTLILILIDSTVYITGPLMTFHNDDKPMFEVPLSDVSASTVNKNEVGYFWR